MAGDTVDTLTAKVQKATAAQKDWAKVPLNKRIEHIRKFGKLLKDKSKELVDATLSETGKPITQCHEELTATASRVEWFCDNVTQATQTQLIHEVKGHLTESISYEPLGVVANISSWSYPYFLATSVHIPALLCGNAVIYKPSELALKTGEKISNLYKEAGLPENLVTPVYGSSMIGSEILKIPFNAIIVHATYQNGQRIALGATKNLTNLQLHLSAKDSAYVHQDVDPKIAAQSLAMGAFYNAGQGCAAVQRIYVHTDVYDSFLENFLAKVRTFKVGDPKDKDTFIGPLTKDAQLNIIEAHLKNAKEQGARVIYGGERPEQLDGYFISPAVVVDTNHTMSIMKQETVGPAVGIQKVSDSTEALSLMKDSEFGLTASVFSKDFGVAKEILSDLSVGTAYWNCCEKASVRLPWSGRKHSGVGATLGIQGIRSFVNPKAWHKVYDKMK
eukprot:TRINITY_DN11026_c0_g1_i1.p1 TRINITY_DN11026_c0_g1~~TRINITY_DN11026_c0_g1_i1.p1  ORF type:complete len:499 (-),score=115.26 TRINITY_DN11026_c0_g1_i1:33-1370(-)